MNDNDRIVWARALMWERASVEEQGKWLNMADEAASSLEAAARRPSPGISAEESDGRPSLRAVR